MPDPSTLRIFWPKFDATADGQAPTSMTVEAAPSPTASSFAEGSLTGADDAYNDGQLLFTSGSNDGLMSHIKDWTLSTTLFELGLPLPQAPAAADTFQMFLPFASGQYRSNLEVAGPSATDPVNINSAGSALAHRQTAFFSGTGNANMKYDGTSLLYFQSPSDSAYGVGVDVSIDGTYQIFSANQSQWIEWVVDSSELPASGSDVVDVITLALTKANPWPNVDGYQAGADLVRTWFWPLRNTGAEAWNDLTLWAEPRADASGTMAAGISTAADVVSLGAGEGSNFPTRSFWLINGDKNDCRYVQFRAGDDLTVVGVGANHRGKTGVSWDTADVVQAWSDVDVGWLAEGSSGFGDPSAATFYSGTDQSSGITAGGLAPSTNVGMVIRETVLAGMYPISSLLSQVRFSAW